MRVPADIREALGKEFVVQSWKTSDRKDAIHRLRSVLGEVQKQLDDARNQLRVPGQTNRLLRRGEISKLSRAEFGSFMRQ